MPKKLLKPDKYQSDNDSDADREINILESDDDLSSIEHEIEYKIQSHQNTSLIKLEKFLKDPAIINPSGDPTTNVIDKKKKCYNIPPNKIEKFFRLLEICRREKIRLTMAEKQLDYSGIVLDFDIYQDEKNNQLTGDVFHMLVDGIMRMLQKIVEIENKDKTIVAITKRPKITFDDKKECYKDGFHIIIPGIQIKRGVKKLLVNKILESEMLSDILEDVIPADINNGDEEYSRNDYLDINSSHIPPFFLGHTTKFGSSAYGLHKVYEVTFKSKTNSVVLNETKVLKSKDVNTSLELSVNWQGKIIEKKHYEVREKYNSEVIKIEAKPEPESEVANNYGSLSTNAVHDYQITEIKDLLDTLNPTRADNYNEWRDVIYALSNTSISYKDLAEYFSRKSPKFDYNGFEKVWNLSLKSSKRPLTLGSLHFWAKQDNPDKYEEIRAKGVSSLLYNMVYEGYREGLLSHADVAKLIHTLLKHKFKTDNPTGSKVRVWYEFVLDDDQFQKEGEIYKWRVWQTSPASLSIYISDTLPKLFDNIYKNVKSNHDKSAGDNSKYYNKVLQNFKSTMRKLGDRNYVKNVITMAEDKFYSHGFADQLDKDPLIRGVCNGVLKLSCTGSPPQLIKGFHTHNISKFTKANYIAFNPYDDMTKKIIITLRSIFPDNEPDSFEYLMYFLASTLDANSKESIFLIIVGHGSNGKSLLVELHKAAIGEHYGAKMPLSFLTSKSYNSDNATPALMQLKDATFVYYSESEKGERLNVSRIKEVTGIETLAGRKLHSDMVNFKPKCHHMVSSNFEFDIDSNDHGTWRRIDYIGLKITFKLPYEFKMDPNDPYTRRADPTAILTWPEDPQIIGRYLGFMVWNHYWLYRKYCGKVRAVPHPHIKFDTDKYRRRQDLISSFIAQRYIKTADPEVEYKATEEIRKYITWYHANTGTTLPSKGLLDQFQNSSIGKHIVLRRGGQYFVGHRFLDNNEQLADGEEYETKNVFDIQPPDDNFGISTETPEQYYERICREYDENKHLFSGESKYEVDDDVLSEYYVVGGVERRNENIVYDENGMALQPGVVLKKLDEPNVANNNTNYDDMLEYMTFDGDMDDE